MTHDRSGWSQYRWWCNRASLPLSLCIVFLILVPSIPAVNDSWCQACYATGAAFLLLAFALMGRAIFSLEVGPIQPTVRNSDKMRRSEE